MSCLALESNLPINVIFDFEVRDDMHFEFHSHPGPQYWINAMIYSQRNVDYMTQLREPMLNELSCGFITIDVSNNVCARGVCACAIFLPISAYTLKKFSDLSRVNLVTFRGHLVYISQPYTGLPT